MNNGSKAFQLGFEIFFSLIVPILVGVYCDSVFHTKPLFILIGVGIGLGSVFLVLWKLAKS